MLMLLGIRSARYSRGKSWILTLNAGHDELGLALEKSAGYVRTNGSSSVQYFQLVHTTSAIIAAWCCFACRASSSLSPNSATVAKFILTLNNMSIFIRSRRRARRNAGSAVYLEPVCSRRLSRCLQHYLSRLRL